MIRRRRSSKIQESQQKLRDKLWPELDESKLWHRKKKKGFITIPRPMPLVMNIMDDMVNGKPVSSAYLELWCRSFDESFVTLSKREEIAFASGFGGSSPAGSTESSDFFGISARPHSGHGSTGGIVLLSAPHFGHSNIRPPAVAHCHTQAPAIQRVAISTYQNTSRFFRR